MRENGRMKAFPRENQASTHGSFGSNPCPHSQDELYSIGHVNQAVPYSHLSQISQFTTWDQGSYSDAVYDQRMTNGEERCGCRAAMVCQQQEKQAERENNGNNNGEIQEEGKQNCLEKEDFEEKSLDTCHHLLETYKSSPIPNSTASLRLQNIQDQNAPAKQRKRQTRTKKSKKEVTQVVNPRLDHVPYAYLPNFGLSSQTLKEKKERLLMRSTQDWQEPTYQTRGGKELKRLNG